jgi:hypothetical protein
VDRRQRRELLLERTPDCERVEKDLAAVQRRDKHLRTEGLLDLLPKEVRNLQTPLLVETSRSTPAKAIHLFLELARDRSISDHFLPLFSRLGHWRRC